MSAEVRRNDHEHSSYTYRRIGLDNARGVGTPIALMRCCIVGLGETPLILRSFSESGVWLRDDTPDPLTGSNLPSFNTRMTKESEQQPIRRNLS